MCRLALKKAPACNVHYVENGEASFRDLLNAIGQALTSVIDRVKNRTVAA